MQRGSFIARQRRQRAAGLVAALNVLAWIPQPSPSEAFTLTPHAMGQDLKSWAGGRRVDVCGFGLRLPNERGQGLLGRIHPGQMRSWSTSVGLRMESQPPRLESVKNVRDLASVANSPIKEGRLFRAACLGTASASDECVLIDFMKIKTLVDLRSEQEWNHDTLKYNSSIFEAYDTMFYQVRKSKKTGRPKAVVPDKPVSETRTRHLISVINENIYKRGVFRKLSLKKKAKAALYMAMNFPKARKLFLDYINDKGLPLLNELILDYGGPSIKAVLQVLSDKKNHPVCFYCTAGKDRTGLIAMLVLACLGVDRECIIEDYVISDTVYADMNDKSAMVGALQQQQLDPDKFLRAPRNVMEATIDLLNSEYGGAQGYMDLIGFTAEDRKRLRSALCDE